MTSIAAVLAVAVAAAPPTIGFDEFAGVNENGAVYRLSLPYLNPDHVPLAPDEFFHVVGRDDLAQQYVSRQHTRAALVIGGVVSILAGSLGGAFAAAHEDAAGSVTYTVGGTTLGIGLILGGALMNADVVDAQAMHAMANAYNARFTSVAR
ncbi:MAG TPA: hypothetical protein VLW85_12425 [Myxococcales bacterium]|nr:hypothetical protein [Myxococcales bacterium]